jgi:hypothetical protein
VLTVLAPQRVSDPARRSGKRCEDVRPVRQRFVARRPELATQGRRL